MVEKERWNKNNEPDARYDAPRVPERALYICSISLEGFFLVVYGYVLLTRIGTKHHSCLQGLLGQSSRLNTAQRFGSQEDWSIRLSGLRGYPAFHDYDAAFNTRFTCKTLLFPEACFV